MGEYGLIKADIMAPENHMKEELFKPDGAL